MARVMIVAGGDWQLPIVSKAKEMGHYVLSTNLYENSPAFCVADEYAVANVLDKDKNLEIAKHWNPDAVLTDQSDIAVPTVAYICNKLGLLGIGEETAKLFTNKYEMRQFENRTGFKHPYFRKCNCYDHAIDAFRTVDFNDAIIKPVDSQSSRGVFHVTRNEDFGEKYEIAEKSSVLKTVIFEEYIDGEEFTVDGLMVEGQYHTLAISRKKHFSFNALIASDLYFSWEDDEYDYAELEEINYNYIMTAGLPFGLTHSEYKYKNGHFYLIEMAARGGGTLISSDIAPYMSGIDGPRELIHYLLREDVLLNEDRREKSALLHFIDVPQGVVKRIDGLEKVKKVDGVHRIKLDFKEGDTVFRPDNDRGRLGFVIIFGKNKNDITNTLTQVESNLNFCIETNGVIHENEY